MFPKLAPRDEPPAPSRKPLPVLPQDEPLPTPRPIGPPNIYGGLEPNSLAALFQRVGQVVPFTPRPDAILPQELLGALNTLRPQGYAVPGYANPIAQGAMSGKVKVLNPQGE